ncbi:hypothetical protein J6590_052753, partial [Homalodisca vitripennis]
KGCCASLFGMICCCLFVVALIIGAGVFVFFKWIKPKIDEVHSDSSLHLVINEPMGYPLLNKTLGL